METLREREPSLLVVEPARSPEININRDYSHISRGEISLGIETIQPEERLVNTSQLSIEDMTASERFARGYHDPLFPIREVSYAAVKRVFDIVVSSVILLVIFPFMFAIALLIKLTSKGPVLFKQVRVGQGGRLFYCYKFRSMCVDAEAQREQLMHLNEASGPVFKIKKDPRVTPIGAFIRKASMDELPQFFNVLKGDMSIVGPRPPLPNEVVRYNGYQRQRLAVLPGITCIWQVSGRSNLSFDRWVQLDLTYIETMSLKNDIKIVLKTIPAVLKGSGAH